jgi:hypothetical protein
MHATQRPPPNAPVSQYGVPPSFAVAQSVPVRQATHACVVVSQTGAAAPVQSVFETQATQRPVVVSHAMRPIVVHGVDGQPAAHWPLRQYGVVLGQSLPETQPTQRFVVVSQTGVLPTHADDWLAVHCTQVWLAVSQIGAPVEHAPVPRVTPGMQPTHAPVDGSQTVAPPAPMPPHVAPPSAEHDA